MNEYYSINDLPLNEQQKIAVLEYLARKYWNLLTTLDIQDGSCKSYDPLTIEGNVAHSYVFDMEDGGRHHPFRDLEHLESMLFNETVLLVREDIQSSKLTGI